jgi:hypothetical protein
MPSRAAVRAWKRIVVCRCRGFVVTWGVAQHQGQKRAREQPPPVICLLLTGSRRCGDDARHELGSRPIATGRVMKRFPRAQTARPNVASAKEFRDRSPHQHGATAISSGKLSTHSWPSLVTMKVCPRKMPNIPSAVIGLGSAMMIMPGLSTLSISSASVRSAKT